jgi:transposase
MARRPRHTRCLPHAWAQRSRIPSFVELSRTIGRHRTAIDATLEHGLIESVNTKIRLITWVAFGFHDPAVPIALAMLSLGGYHPPLPGR